MLNIFKATTAITIGSGQTQMNLEPFRLSVRDVMHEVGDPASVFVEDARNGKYVIRKLGDLYNPEEFKGQRPHDIPRSGKMVKKFKKPLVELIKVADLNGRKIVYDHRTSGTALATVLIFEQYPWVTDWNQITDDMLNNLDVPCWEISVSSETDLAGLFHGCNTSSVKTKPEVDLKTGHFSRKEPEYSFREIFKGHGYDLYDEVDFVNQKFRVDSITNTMKQFGTGKLTKANSFNNVSHVEISCRILVTIFTKISGRGHSIPGDMVLHLARVLKEFDHTILSSTKMANFNPEIFSHNKTQPKIVYINSKWLQEFEHMLLNTGLTNAREIFNALDLYTRVNHLVPYITALVQQPNPTGKNFARLAEGQYQKDWFKHICWVKCTTLNVTRTQGWF